MLHIGVLLSSTAAAGLLRLSRRNRLCEKSLEPETYRIVFSIVVTGQKLAMQLVSASTKLSQIFYVQIVQPTFHTAWKERERENIKPPRENRACRFPRHCGAGCRGRSRRGSRNSGRRTRLRNCWPFSVMELFGPDREGDVLRVGAFELRGLERFHVVDGLRQPLPQFLEGLFGVGRGRHLASASAARSPCRRNRRRAGSVSSAAACPDRAARRAAPRAGFSSPCNGPRPW